MLIAIRFTRILLANIILIAPLGLTLLAAVGLLPLSGAAETWPLPGSAVRLSAAPCVTVLAAKPALVALLLGIAPANRFGLVPRPRAVGSVDVATLLASRRNVALGQLLGLLVPAVVSVLGLLPPPLS